MGDTVPGSTKDTTKTDSTQNDSDKGLINLDLLNTNDPDNVLKLDIGDQEVLGIGLGGTVTDSSKDTTKIDSTQNDSDKGLINLDLLNTNDPDNVLKLDIGDQEILGIGLGGTVPDSTKDTTKTDSTQNDSDKGLINLDLLNANDPDNVLKLDIGDQEVLGIGLGGTVPDSSKDITKSDSTQNHSDKGLINLDLLNTNDPDNVLKLDIGDQEVLGIGLGGTVPDSSKDTTKTYNTQTENDKGLITLDLLNTNDPDNVLNLDIGDQEILGIGLGDT
ncbi:unnamed protein product [Parnassius apollo]|uniref:(apollo) hypothetical protein n=1 Tax=Parnassius apollo TaxID=110799 RepID=A0A8S3WJE9_PARAO|nr:unnamed protein product [Parnassius apollo]